MTSRQDLNTRKRYSAACALCKWLPFVIVIDLYDRSQMKTKHLKRGRMTLRIEPEPLECWCQDFLLEINKCIIAQPNYKSIRLRVNELVLKCQLNKSYQISEITCL